MKPFLRFAFIVLGGLFLYSLATHHLTSSYPTILAIVVALGAWWAFGSKGKR